MVAFGIVKALALGGKASFQVHMARFPSRNPLNPRWIRFVLLGAIGVFTIGISFAQSEDGAAAPLGPPRHPVRADTPYELSLWTARLTAPTALIFPDGSPETAWVADQTGRIYEITEKIGDSANLIVDLGPKLVSLNQYRRDERGLLGLAAHPDFQRNGRFFVYYSAPALPSMPRMVDHIGRISEFRASTTDPGSVDPDSERVVLEILQLNLAHNGVQLAFGPDGYLYIGLGDGGGRGDPFGNAQNIHSFEGSILRIDVDRGEPYAIPPTNPFANGVGADEIYAYGFRNPYRFSFDPEGEYGLLVGDVGQSQYEELNQVSLGGNYGWNIMEGRHCFDPQTEGTLPSCASHGKRGEELIPPFVEYGHDEGIAIVGALLYRGSEFSDLYGSVVFADYTGQLFRAKPGRPPSVELWNYDKFGGDLDLFILSLVQGPQGQLYLLTTENTQPVGNTGKVFRLMRP